MLWSAAFTIHKLSLCTTHMVPVKAIFHLFHDFLFSSFYRWGNRGGLSERRQNAPNLPETWGPREWGSLAGMGWGTSFWRQHGRRNGMRNCARPDWEVAMVEVLKNKIRNKNKLHNLLSITQLKNDRAHIQVHTYRSFQMLQSLLYLFIYFRSFVSLWWLNPGYCTILLNYSSTVLLNYISNRAIIDWLVRLFYFIVVVRSNQLFMRRM